MQKCAYIYIHMYIILSIIYIVVYIYIYISLYIMSLKFTDPDCWYMLFYPSLYQVSRVGRPLHVERASQINAAPFFSPSGLSPRNMEVLGSWEPWDNTLWNKLWITYECMGVCIYIEKNKYIYIYYVGLCVYIDGHIRITGSYDFCVSSKHTWGNDGEHLIYTWITWRM